MKQHLSSRAQRGGFVIGLIVGLLIGLALALGVALYVTKAPNPFVNKVPARSPGQDAAETERNRNWDPNSALAGRNPAAPGSPPGPASAPDPGRPAVAAPAMIDALPQVASAPRVGRAPAGSASAVAAAPATAARASQPVSTGAGSSPFSYFVQAGAYARSEDAEQQRAKLAMLGVESRLTEREQSGRTVYRVRVGPFDRREEAENAKVKLSESGVDSALVAVQR